MQRDFIGFAQKKICDPTARGPPTNESHRDFCVMCNMIGKPEHRHVVPEAIVILELRDQLREGWKGPRPRQDSHHPEEREAVREMAGVLPPTVLLCVEIRVFVQRGKEMAPCVPRTS